MKKVFLMLLTVSLLLLSACVNNGAESQQSIQDVINQQPGINAATDNETETINVETNQSRVITATKVEEPTGVTDEIPKIHKKCRFSVILYDGCKWKDQTKTTFSLKIISASRQTIPGVWFFLIGESGTKTLKRDEQILSKGTKTYNLDYPALTTGIGEIKRFEIYPIEEINGTQYACENQRIYTIPTIYCKESEPIDLG